MTVTLWPSRGRDVRSIFRVVVLAFGEGCSIRSGSSDLTAMMLSAMLSFRMQLDRIRTDRPFLLNVTQCLQYLSTIHYREHLFKPLILCGSIT